MTISIQEAYNTLGLEREATQDEVKKAYRKLALQFHPDKNPDPAATAKFQQLSAAYKRVDDHLQRGGSDSFQDFFGDFDEFEEEDLDFDDDLGMPSMEEMLFMFDMLFGPQPQATRRSGGRRKGKKCNGGVCVNVRRKGGKYPSYIDQEFMDMFAHGMMFDGPDSDLSDLEDEFMSMASFFTSSGMNFDSRIPEKRKANVEMGKCGSSKQNEPDTKSNAAPKSQHVEPEKAPKPAPTVGSKVCIHGKHAGIVKFAGHVHYAKGEFVGVALSSPVGKNDGSVKGVKYFECSPSHGLMVRPNDVTLAA